MKELVLVDGHVHIYRNFDVRMFADAALGNLDAGGRAASLRAPWERCVLLTERAGDDAFARLRAGRGLPGGWSVDLHDDDSTALKLRRGDGEVLLVVAGRQIVTAERLEVLAVGTAESFDDGQPADAVLDALHEARRPAILPWGLGKWTGARGRRVAELMAARAHRGGLLLGDNAGRPRGWRRPPLFRRAAELGLPILPGTDPLPLPGAERRVGRFGFVLEGALDANAPGSDLAARLFCLRDQPRRFGRRTSALAALSDQARLRAGRSAT